MRLPERLLRIASYVPRSSSVADIGTDHALLPVYLVKQNICGRVIATDLNPGPLEAANSTVDLFNLWRQVELRLGDGLSVIQPGEVDVIIIAGMGGNKISEILNGARSVLQQSGRLILQPLAGVPHVRSWLLSNGWVLADEDLVIDDGRFYEIIIAEPANRAGELVRGASANPDEDELFTGGFTLADGSDYHESGAFWLEIGPRLFEKKHQLLVPHLEKQIKDMESVLRALRRAQTPAARQRMHEWTGKIAFYKNVIKEMKAKIES